MKIGYYTPFMIVDSVLMCTGAGCLILLEPDTGPALYIGLQILFGFGTGLGVQQPSVAAQTVLADEDVSIGAASMMLGQQLGSSVFISIAQAALTNNLESGLEGSQGLDPSLVLSSGATAFRTLVPLRLLDEVIAAYNVAIVSAIMVAVGLAVVSIMGTFAIVRCTQG